MERDRLLCADKLDSAQLRRRTTREIDDRSLRHARRLADGKTLRRPPQVRWVRRAHRDAADEGAICHPNDCRIGRGAAVGHDERQRATDRSEVRLRHAVARHRYGRRAPSLARRALRERDLRAAAGSNLHHQLFAAHHSRREAEELQLGQQGAVPRLYG